MTAMTRIEAMQTAKRMHDQGGWTVTAIHRYLNNRGHSCAWSSVKKWVNPEYAARVQAEDRKRQRDRWRREHGTRFSALRVITDAEKLERLKALRDAGLSCEATASVIALDFGDRLSRDQVSRAEQTGKYPVNERREATA